MEDYEPQVPNFYRKGVTNSDLSESGADDQTGSRSILS
jgi:hypothetical protein